MKKTPTSKPKAAAPKSGKAGRTSTRAAAPRARAAAAAAKPAPSEPKPSASRKRDVADSLKKAMVAVEAALDKKGLEPQLLDLHDQGSYTDYMLLVSGRSDRHVSHVAEGIIEALRDEAGLRPIGVEGLREGRWVLIDFGEIVAHVFHHPLREFYDLEGLWHDAPRVPLEIPAEARVGAEPIY